MRCRGCGNRRRLRTDGLCAECLEFQDTCARCGGNFRGHTDKANLDHIFLAQQREPAS